MSSVSANGILDSPKYTEIEKLQDGTTLNEQLIKTFQTLHLFRQKAQFTDVTLCVGNENIPCHKVILAASSPYFHAMFSSPYKEQQTSHVILDHVSPFAVRWLLDFAYLGVMELSETSVQEVFTAASLLDYPLATKACVQFMERHLDVTNCLGVEALAELHGLSSLGRIARKMAIENFSTLISESSEWPLVPLPTVLSYLRSDDLDVPSEQSIWDACMMWIGYDPVTRLARLPTLLSHVRLQHLSPNFLRTQLTHNCYIQEHSLAQDLIKRALDGALDQPPRPATLKRPTLIVLGGLTNSILNCMQSFSPTKTSWLPCPSMPVDSLAWFSVSVVSNILFVIGGIKAGSIMSTVYSYSPSLGRWAQCCSMPQPRARHAAVTVGSSHIFVFGGLTTGPNVVATTPGAGQFDATARLGRIVPDTFQPAHGGVSPSVIISNTIIRYDLYNDSWTTVGKSTQPRLESCVLVVDDSGGGGESPRNTPPPVPSPRVMEYTCESDSNSSSLVSQTSTSSTDVPPRTSYALRQRHLSAHKHTERTLVEIGGVSETYPQGTDQVLFYRLRSDLTVAPTGDYVKLPQFARYVSAAIRQSTNLVYVFWEQTSELSVLDLTRRTLLPLSPLATRTESSSLARIHCGLTWVGSQLYVVGGFSDFAGDDRRPVMPRDDIHCYDPDRDEWTLIKVANDTIPRAIFGCVCLNM